MDLQDTGRPGTKIYIFSRRPIQITQKLISTYKISKNEMGWQVINLKKCLPGDKLIFTISDPISFSFH
jgi:hypothetical protein